LGAHGGGEERGHIVSPRPQLVYTEVYNNNDDDDDDDKTTKETERRTVVN